MQQLEEVLFNQYEPITITQASQELNVTRQAVFLAIKMQRLVAFKHDHRWLILKSDLNHYVNNKYSRKLSRREGALIFDRKKGQYSINDVSNILKVDQNRVYYLVRLGKIKTSRSGGNIVILHEDLRKFIDKEAKISSRKKRL